MLDKPFGPGDGVSMLTNKPIRFKVKYPDAWIEACKDRYALENGDNSEDAVEWAKLARRFKRCEAWACFRYAKNRASICRRTTHD